MNKYNIYLVISKTPTLVGRVIRQVLDNHYNHMSLGMSEDLRHLYSFGRVSARNSLAGGPLRESYYTMSLGGKNDVEICVFRIPVTKQQFDLLYDFIRSVFYDVDGYVYNLASALATLFHRQIKIDKCYTCIEFCKDAMAYAGIPAVNRLEGINTLDKAAQVLSRYKIFEGSYILYPGVFTEKTIWDERFLRKRSLREEVVNTASSYQKFFKRTLRGRIL